jgi:hypothetical protein
MIIRTRKVTKPPENTIGILISERSEALNFMLHLFSQVSSSGLTLGPSPKEREAGL